MKPIRVTCLHNQGHTAAMALSAVLSLTAIASACNVPVFRFALERWRPDVYRVTLLHRGPLSESQREISRPLEDAQEKGSANFVLQAVDVNKLEKPADNVQGPLTDILNQAWSRVENGQAWLIVQYPTHLGIDVPVWSEPLTQETVARLTGSPLRQELVRRLADGQTAVWLLLESGLADRDNAAAELLEDELKGLEQSLKLPQLTSDPDDQLLSSTPLKVAFSVLRVPRTGVTEDALAGMLVRCEPDLADRTDPIVYPVFGRGRALLPLIGAGITAKNIQDAAAFLVGACSCQVKEQNPGFDLLLSVEWDGLLSQTGQQLTATQTTVRNSLSSGQTQLVPIPSGSREETIEAKAVVASEPDYAASTATHHSWLVAGGLLIGMAAFVVLLSALHAGKS